MYIQTCQTLQATCRCWKKQRRGCVCRQKRHVETAECRSVIGPSGTSWLTACVHTAHHDSSLMVNKLCYYYYYYYYYYYCSRASYSSVLFCCVFYRILGCEMWVTYVDDAVRQHMSPTSHNRGFCRIHNRKEE